MALGMLCLVFDVQAKEERISSEIDILSKEFEHCEMMFKINEQKCSDSWKMQCFNHLRSVHNDVTKCYKKVATDLLQNFYGLSNHEADKKYDDYVNFVYDQYLFLYNDNTYCKKNNCGVSPYLYSDYATTQDIHNYIQRMLQSVKARI